MDIEDNFSNIEPSNLEFVDLTNEEIDLAKNLASEEILYERMLDNLVSLVNLDNDKK